LLLTAMPPYIVLPGSRPAQDAQQRVCQMEPGPGFAMKGSRGPVPDAAPFRGPGLLARVTPFALVAVAAEASLALPPGTRAWPAVTARREGIAIEIGPAANGTRVGWSVPLRPVP
jgi:hypothetical protein